MKLTYFLSIYFFSLKMYDMRFIQYMMIMLGDVFCIFLNLYRMIK